MGALCVNMKQYGGKKSIREGANFQVKKHELFYINKLSDLILKEMDLYIL